MNHSEETQLWMWMMDGGSHGGERWATAELTRPLKFSRWTGKRDEKNECIMHEFEMPAGSPVRVNMSSRFGWLGLHSDMEKENGYEFCLQAVDIIEPVKKDAETGLTNIVRKEGK